MKTFYAINLNQKYGGKSRWALYEMKKTGMEVVWPASKPNTDKRDLLPNQVFYPRKGDGPDKYPAYHFVSNGYGLSHIEDIAYNLAQHFQEDIEIFELHGHNPSPHTATWNRPVSVLAKVKGHVK